MSHYQVLARRYRPKTFKEVVGQAPVVTTLQNALLYNRLAHAYLFCGSRGTGKTTLARIFAKALNCEKRGSDGEPCATCPSCREIASGQSIDVLEIDGASHRGIDDIRLITESVGYAPSKGRFKIYLIDEVHMLTKEAFNALLKTLEEPPATAKFFFATTEPQKLPATIISRCQRFNLRRIPETLIIAKLHAIAKDLKIQVEEEALSRIAEYAEGGLRDAESLFDQLIAFSDGKVTAHIVSDVLGVLSRSYFFELDKAFAHTDYTLALKIATEVFIQGKDFGHFLNDLAQHYRKLLLMKLSPNALTNLETSYKNMLLQSQALYTKEQCLTIIEHILETQEALKNTLSTQLTLEALLLRILREKNRLSIDYLVERLVEVEKNLGNSPVIPAPSPDPRLEILPALEKKIEKQASAPEPIPAPLSSPSTQMPNKPRHDTLMQFASVELGGTLQRKK